MLKTKLYVLLIVFYFCSGQYYELPYGYHMKVGVPKAESLFKEASPKNMKIIGGHEVTAANPVPYQAGIIVKLTPGRYSICGGVLISNTRVLTAAHCWWDGQSQAKLFTIVLGSLSIVTGGTRIKTSDVTVHPFWNVDTKAHDIAIAKIRRITFTCNIQAISLPSNYDINRHFAGMMGTVSGYGKTSNDLKPRPTLYETDVVVLCNDVCQESFRSRISDIHICTSGEGIVGTCHGDSGGPLTVVRNYQRILIGLVSFGPGIGCDYGYPSVYTRVTFYLNWIRDNMVDNKICLKY